MRFQLHPVCYEDQADVRQMIKALYDEDPDGDQMHDEHIDRTFQYLTKNPQHGEVLVLWVNEVIAGYTILIPFWSNEYGGKLLIMDELYIKPEFRSRQLGSKLINFLAQTRHQGSRAIFLEVAPYNLRAYLFYLRNGFTEGKNKTLKFVFDDAVSGDSQKMVAQENRLVANEK
jgi:ribosomal protein S18 acetylase RimI-like enzyme